MPSVPKRLRVLIGMVLAVLIFSAGAVVPEVTRETSSDVDQEVAANPGRFTIIINPNVRADTYLLDSATGKVWKPISYTDVVGEPTVWQYMDRIDDEEGFEAWVAKQKIK